MKTLVKKMMESNPPRLGRPASAVRDRCAVDDGIEGEAGDLQAADGLLAARADALGRCPAPMSGTDGVRYPLTVLKICERICPFIS